jgi:hypothetical protein
MHYIERMISQYGLDISQKIIVYKEVMQVDARSFRQHLSINDETRRKQLHCKTISLWKRNCSRN